MTHTLDTGVPRFSCALGSPLIAEWRHVHGRGEGHLCRGLDSVGNLAPVIGSIAYQIGRVAGQLTGLNYGS